MRVYVHAFMYALYVRIRPSVCMIAWMDQEMAYQVEGGGISGVIYTSMPSTSEFSDTYIIIDYRNSSVNTKQPLIHDIEWVSEWWFNAVSATDDNMINITRIDDARATYTAAQQSKGVPEVHA